MYSEYMLSEYISNNVACTHKCCCLEPQDCCLDLRNCCLGLRSCHLDLQNCRSCKTTVQN